MTEEREGAEESEGTHIVWNVLGGVVDGIEGIYLGDLHEGAVRQPATEKKNQPFELELRRREGAVEGVLAGLVELAAL